MKMQQMVSYILGNKSCNVVVNGVKYEGTEIKLVIDNKEIASYNNNITISVEGDCKIVESTNGDINVSGNTTEISTTNGDVDVGGEVKGHIRTTNGNVCASIISGSVSTINGNVKV